MQHFIRSLLQTLAPSAKGSQLLWKRPSDSDLNKVPPPKRTSATWELDLPLSTIFSLNNSRHSAKATKCFSVCTFPVMVPKALSYTLPSWFSNVGTLLPAKWQRLVCRFLLSFRVVISALLEQKTLWTPNSNRSKRMRQNTKIWNWN